MCSWDPFSWMWRYHLGQEPWNAAHLSSFFDSQQEVLGCKFLWSFSSQKMPPGLDKRLELELIPGEREFLMDLFLGAINSLKFPRGSPITPNLQGMWGFLEGESSNVFLPLDGAGFGTTSVQMCWENPKTANSWSSTIPSISHPKRIPKIPLDFDLFSILEQVPDFSLNIKKTRKTPRKLPWKLPEARDLQLLSFSPLFFIPHPCQGGISFP